VLLVPDVNIAVSGLLWHGPPAEVLRAAQTGQAVLATSSELLAELRGVLDRPKLRRAMMAAGISPARAFQTFLELTGVYVDAPPLSTRVSRDPDDDAVLACGLAAGASVIVTGDRDLLVRGSFEGIPIVDARSALELIARAASGA
jgi:putative PIN family toxin of toxin-antitoxin system